MSNYENREVSVDQRLLEIKESARAGGCSWDDIRAQLRQLAHDRADAINVDANALYIDYCKRVGALPN